MQQLFMFLDLGDGWRSVNNHANGIAALMSLSVRWGVDDPSDQPDPAVMSFTLIDRTGWLAGRAMTLAGARVVIQISAEPTWGMLTRLGSWGVLDMPLGNLHQAYVPDTPDKKATGLVTLFDGLVSNGGDCEPKDDGWRINLSASGRMILWKRLQKQGPTSNDARYEGYHWVGKASERLAELNRRAIAAGAPTMQATGLDLTHTLAPYQLDTFPTQFDLLHRSCNANGLIVIYEYPKQDASYLSYERFGVAYHIRADGDARIYATDSNGALREALDAKDVEADESLTLDIPEPVTQFTINGKTAKADDKGKLQFEDDKIEIGDAGRLPANLKATQSSIVIDTDTVTSDQSGGAYQQSGGNTWHPTDAERLDYARIIETIDGRLRPKTVTFDSRRIDPVKHPRLFMAASSGPLVIQGMKASRLANEQGISPVSGLWATVGGTITYRWVAGRPVIRNEVTLWPIPQSPHSTTWGAMRAWPAAWSQCGFTLVELAMIEGFDQTRTLTLDQPNFNGF